MFYHILIFIIVCIVHYAYMNYGRKGKRMREIPGPTILPIIGNLYKFQKSAEEIWITLRKYSKEYYPGWKVWSFTVPCVNLMHPDDLEVILSNMKHSTKSYIYSLLWPWFGGGLLTSSGAKWQNRRKILTPAFHFNVLQQFVEVFIEESLDMVDKLKVKKAAVIQDLMPLISDFTLNAICETAMGTSLKGKGKEFQLKYKTAVYDMAKVLLHRLVRPWYHVPAIWICTIWGWRERKILGILHGFTKQIIEERKQYHDKTGGKYLVGFDTDDNANYTQTTEDFSIRKKRLAMLDLLLAAQKQGLIDDEGIREEVDTFMFEGHDTTAMALCYAVMLLAEHKEIQEKARAEVDEAFSAYDGKFTFASLQRLPYLERCIKESLRMYPSVHFISRDIQEEVQLKNFIIPGGCVTNIHIVDTHRDPAFWPNPEIYDPDRFLPENCQGRHNFCYVPFSAGPRNCIGQRFAMFEMKTCLAHILHNFRLEPIDYLKDVRFVADLVIRPGHPIRTKFIPIE